MADRPKRPLSAYMLWLNDNRESIKREHPGIKVTEVAKRGGELWRNLKDKTGTQKWEQKAVEAKERYVKQMKEFEANGGGKEVSKKRGSKTTRKAPAKKGKKKNDSEDDDDEEDESD